MALCVRSVTNKIIPFNGVVHSKRNTDKLLKKIPVRSQFLEDFLSIRRSSSCQVANSTSKDAAIEDNTTVAEQFFRSRLENANRENSSTWHTQALSDGTNGMTMKVKRYLPTQDDMILWSSAPSQSVIETNKFFNDLHFSGSTISQCQHLLHCQESALSDFDNRMILLSKETAVLRQRESPAVSETTCSPPSQDQNQHPNHCNEEQLERAFNELASFLPNLFVRTMDYRAYHSQIVFINNIRGTKSVGIHKYVQQLGMLRIIGHFKFAFVKLDVIKMTKHMEDSSVRVRWRITGISGLRVMAMFWKYKLWQLKETISQQESWYDGFSTFYVGGDGLIHTHIADKVMPDDDNLVVNNKSTMAAKLALLLGLVPRSAITDACAFLYSVAGLKKADSLAFPMEKLK